MLFMYTDGLTEAEDINKNLFGENAALAAFSKAVSDGNDSAKACVGIMYESVLAHTAGAEQNDDITMLAIEYKGPDTEGN